MNADINVDNANREDVHQTRTPMWPQHLLQPGPSRWTWWRDAVLRSAGFQADNVELMSNRDFAQVADAANRAHQHLRETLAEGEHELRERIEALRARADASAKEALRALNPVQKRLKQLREGGSTDVPTELAPAVVKAIQEAVGAWCAAFDRLRPAHGDAIAEIERVSKAFASDSMFRAAVGWQNIEALGTALDPVARGSDMPGSKRRQREALIASYVQRYCVKNDSIGFFGPLAWIRIEDEDSASHCSAGTSLVSSRSVHFEDWAIDAFATRLASDDRYVPWLVARLQPYLRLEGRMLHLPGAAKVALDEREALLLSLCDGSRDCRSLTRALLANPFGPFNEDGEVRDALRRLQRSDRITLAFQVPSCGDNPDLALLRELERIDDMPLREAALNALGELIAARKAILAAATAEDPDLLATTMAGLGEVFERVVGGPQRRRQGEVYGGRALVYEDCHRDVDLTLSARTLAPATDALELVMTSARWFTCAAWRSFEAAFDTEFDRQRADRPGAASVPLTDLWVRLQGIVFGDHVPLDGLAAELRDRWECLLRELGTDGADAHRLVFDLDALRPAVRAAFATDGQGWRLARYHCPDIMFCADGPEQLLAGDYVAVLGEVHVGGNTVATNLFASQHPRRERLLESLRSDLGDPYVMPKLSPQASGTPTRTQWLDDPGHAIEVVFSRGFVPADAQTALPISDLDVFRQDGGLHVRHRDLSWQASLCDVLGDFLFLAVINRFGLMHKRDHTPRVTFGRLVVQRESWSYQARELEFALLDDEIAAFCSLRAWRDAQKLPAQAFVKMAWEAKPVYFDFDSIVSMRMLAKQVRHALALENGGASRLSFSEMLPALDELWLKDSAGRRYTCELRLVGLHADDAVAEMQDRRA